MSKAMNKSTKNTVSGVAAMPYRGKFNYAGPNLWGVSRVIVAGRGAGTLGEVSCDWVRGTRTCTVVLDSGETIYVEGGELSVA